MEQGTIVVTGSTGFLGRHLMPLLHEKYGSQNIKGLSSQDYDLMNPVHVETMFKDLQPDIVIHLAAYSGGIGANREYPADFFYKNITLCTLMFEYATRHKVKKLIYTMGGCSYPAKVVSPISEDQMWEGYPQAESAGYSVAKKMGITASQSYRTQYGLNSVVLIPGNMYGEYDNFRNNESHVVPGMIRRYYETKLRGESTITMWGDGTPVRDFVYAADVAKSIPWFIENYNSSEPVNISSGTETPIKVLAETIKEKMNWEGTIDWDTSKPNGQLIKIFDVTRLSDLGLVCETPLSEGLEKTIDWLTKHYQNQTDGIRL